MPKRQGKMKVIGHTQQPPSERASGFNNRFNLLLFLSGEGVKSEIEEGEEGGRILPASDSRLSAACRFVFLPLEVE